MAEHIYIKFYGIYDYVSSTHLHEAETIFGDWEKYIKVIDINSALELYSLMRSLSLSTAKF